MVHSLSVVGKWGSLLGPFSYAWERIQRAVRCPVSVEPPPAGILFERDLQVRVRDGTILRLNVFRPESAGRYPVLMSAHPYSKDRLAYRLPPMYRLLRQSEPFTLSHLTGWEAPDPGRWVPWGYVVINADLRGFFRSEGRGSVLSRQEAEDYFDLIEWASAQPWSNGKVGLSGVSYLALSQYAVAALRPPSLAAICPWEGFSDVYRDLAYPGGVREDGFVPFWTSRLPKQRLESQLRQQQLEHPMMDDMWMSMTPELECIEVPALICASFSDQNLHTRGSFEAFRRISSSQKWLFTHRQGKWAAFYREPGLSWQKRFFDHFLRGENNGMNRVAPVRLEVRSSRDRVYEVRETNQWPPTEVAWKWLELGPTPVECSLPDGCLQLWHRFEEETLLAGPMRLQLEVELQQDACLFAGVRKFSAGQEVVFEGSYGFGRDMVSRGFLRASHRQLDEQRTTPWRPWHSHQQLLPVPPDTSICLDLEMLPSATHFAAGDQLRLDLQGRYFYPRNPLWGQFPAGYEVSPKGRCRLLRCRLLVPQLPQCLEEN